MKAQAINHNAETADNVLMQLVWNWNTNTEKSPCYLDVFCSNYVAAKTRLESMWKDDVLFVIISTDGIRWHYGEIYTEQQALEAIENIHVVKAPRLYRVTCIEQNGYDTLPQYQIEAYV